MTDDQEATNDLRPISDYAWLDVFTQALEPFFHYIPTMKVADLLSDQTMEFTKSTRDGKVEIKVQFFNPAVMPRYKFQVKQYVTGVLAILEEWARNQKTDVWHESRVSQIKLDGVAAANIQVYLTDEQGGSGVAVATA